MCKCPVCGGLQTHLVAMRETVRGAFVEVETRYAEVKLSETAKERIRSVLAAETGQPDGETPSDEVDA